MNASELAQTMLAWEELMVQAKALEDQIKEVVLSLEKTQVVGNVRATYSTGRKSYQYEDAWREHGLDTGLDIEDYEKISYDYKKACEDGGLDVPFTQSDPSVLLKLQEVKS